MKGLCHDCFSSNVELKIIHGIPTCEICAKPKEPDIVIDKSGAT